jgi:hypothetical protein
MAETRIGDTSRIFSTLHRFPGFESCVRVSADIAAVPNSGQLLSTSASLWKR